MSQNRKQVLLCLFILPKNINSFIHTSRGIVVLEQVYFRILSLTEVHIAYRLCFFRISARLSISIVIWKQKVLHLEVFVPGTETLTGNLSQILLFKWISQFVQRGSIRIPMPFCTYLFKRVNWGIKVVIIIVNIMKLRN